jgi:LPXTG-motif cell wall-anchored protein
MSSRSARLASLAVLVVGSLGLTLSAAADGNFVEATSDPGAIRLMPGSEADPEFLVRNDSGATTSLRVQVTGVAEDDNGCVLPEVQEGDVTCGEGGGELGDWLELRIVRVENAGEHELWSGSLDQLEAGADLLEDVSAGDSPRIRVQIALPRATTNDTMSDRVQFSLRWTYTGVTGQTTVLGVEQSSGEAAGPHAGALADTGTTMSAAMLAVVAALLLSGGVLAARSRRPRARSAVQTRPAGPVT